MDRADTAPDEGVGERVPTRANPVWGRDSVPGRTADAERQDRSGSQPRTSGQEWSAIESGSTAEHRAPECSGGVVPAPGSERGQGAPRRGGRARRPELHDAPDPRPAHPLGKLLYQRGDELQLAAAAGARSDPRLRGRARGRAPRRAGPLGALLAPAGVTLSGVAGARGVAAPAWACAAVLSPPRGRA